MTEPRTEIGIDDLVNAIFVNSLQRSGAQGGDEDEEQVQRQITPATPEQMREIEALAAQAATLQDELKLILAQVVGTRSQELNSLKAQLLDRMLNHNLAEVWVPGRPPIEVITRKERKASKKSIIAALSQIHGDPKKGATEGTKLWNSIPQVDKESLSIPDRTPPEVESPY